MSVCQTASPAPKLPIGFPSAPRTLETTYISGYPGTGVRPFSITGAASSSPKRAANSTRASFESL